MTKPKLRCAVYTRKSSEEGLEQDFNSLDAQREACEAYIVSQRGEGWSSVRTHYDDGGYSGGNMDRPGLEQLLSDIDAGRIDVVVVYKVDRLTRSLPDFAKIIDRFDARKVSFVSVTQSFNTTTSMGRLTLNVLLSFAQFEREVTGERIRDKIAASKAKGMWMGGTPPLGYDPAGGTVTINNKEAETVRWIFRRYVEIKSVDALVAELAARRIRSKARVSSRGNRVGGFPIGRGALNHMLQNPIYLGQIRHKDKIYPGKHKAIVSRALWDQVQKAIGDNRCERTSEQTRAHHEWWLTGKLFDEKRRPMTPTFSTGARGGRYKYYAVKRQRGVDQDAALLITRVRMELVHNIVKAAVERHLANANAACSKPLTSVIREVRICADKMRIDIELPTPKGRTSKSGRTLIEIAIGISRRGRRSEIIPPVSLQLGRVSPKITNALRLGWQWREELIDGSHVSGESLAQAKNLTKRYVNKMLALCFLPPTQIKDLLGVAAA